MWDVLAIGLEYHEADTLWKVWKTDLIANISSNLQENRGKEVLSLIWAYETLERFNGRLHVLQFHLDESGMVFVRFSLNKVYYWCRTSTNEYSSCVFIVLWICCNCGWYFVIYWWAFVYDLKLSTFSSGFLYCARINHLWKGPLDVGTYVCVGSKKVSVVFLHVKHCDYRDSM